MEINFFQDDEPLHFERIVLYPYPDLKRIWARLWVSAQQDKSPNIELHILNPDGSENCSIDLLTQSEQRHEKTLHMQDPVAGETYRVVARLTLGLNESPELLDEQEFDMILEFRNPEEKEPGFGFGVDWDQYREAV